MNRIRRLLINHLHHCHAPFAITFHQHRDAARQLRRGRCEAEHAFRFFGHESILREFFQPGRHRFFTALNAAEDIGHGPALRRVFGEQTKDLQLLDGLDMPADEFLKVVE